MYASSRGFGGVRSVCVARAATYRGRPAGRWREGGRLDGDAFADVMHTTTRERGRLVGAGSEVPRWKAQSRRPAA
jgi:hypothetical protein